MNSYAPTVTHVRVYKECGKWYLDAADDYNWCSEACAELNSWAEAMALIPEFIVGMVGDGVRWQGR